MNRKGFTLIELLVVIAILGLVALIAVPSISAVTNIIKDNMLEKKLNLIESSAVLYGDDIKGSIIASTKKYNTYPCKSYLVEEFVIADGNDKNYLDKDNDNVCLTSSSAPGTPGCIVDPSDENNYLDLYEVIIYYKNKRIHAIVDKDNNLSCE